MADDKELRVRLPAGTRAQLQRFADDTHRSLTGATIFLLEQALEAEQAARPGRGLTGLIPPDPPVHYRQKGTPS